MDILAISDQIWIAILGGGQAVIVAVIALVGTFFARRTSESRNASEEVRKQVTGSNGKTMAQLVEAVNDKVDLFMENQKLHQIELNTALDEQLKTSARHIADDERKFNKLFERMGITEND